MTIGCPTDFDPGLNGEEPTSGTIEGYAYFLDEIDHSGILILAESTTGIATVAVAEAIEGRRIDSKVISGQSVTDSSGYYELLEMEPGTYTIYASFQHSLERAVTTGVEMVAGKAIAAADMGLSPTGSVSGIARLGNPANGNIGIVVYIAGTSYMAMTDDAGNYTITGVPVGSRYALAASKEGYTDATLSADVTIGGITQASMIDLTRVDVWEGIRQFGTTSDDVAHGVAVDPNGDVHIAGYTKGTLEGTNKGMDDVFVAKYNNTGTQQWVRQLGTTANDLGYGVAMSTDGDVYITGHTDGALDGTNQGGPDCSVVKYNSAGTQRWIRQLGTTGDDYAYGVAADPNGDAYVAGNTDGALSGTNQGVTDVFLLKMDRYGDLQ